MTETKTIPLPDGGRINARVDGPEGAPWVVFCNSVLTDMSIWEAQTKALSGDFRVLRYDQRGHGRSTAPKGAMTFDDYGEDLLAVAEAFGVTRSTFVGLSMGAPTGLAAYVKRPGLFSAFVLVDGVSRSATGREAYWTERREMARAEGMDRIAAETAHRWLPGVQEGAPEWQRLTRMIAATPVDGFAAATHALGNYDHSEALDSFDLPFLGIAGALDGAMPDAIRKQFGSLDTATFAEIPGAGHLPNFQNPDAFNDVLRAFLVAHAYPKTKEIY